MVEWLSDLIKELNWGCENSPYIRDLHTSEDSLSTGRELCLVLWPFISALPANVSLVMSKLPEQMTAAHKFFGQLKDDDRHYQRMFIKGCLLAGIEEETIRATVPGEATLFLCDLMNHYCTSDDFNDGVLAIVTAELAATCFARHSLPYFEKYFEHHADEVRKISVDEGLEWLRLHAKPHPKHAIWLRRTIEAVETKRTGSPTNKLPEPVERLVAAIHKFQKSDRAAKDSTTDEADAQYDPKNKSDLVPRSGELIRQSPR